MTSRRRALGGVAALAVLLVWVSWPRQDEEDVARTLAQAISGEVAVADYVWEPSGGMLHDLFLGREVLFLGRRGEDAPRDLYRASARVTPGGRTLHVTGAKRIVDTRLGDERDLYVRGRRAAVATWWDGRYRSITAIELGDDGSTRRTTYGLSEAASQLRFEIADDDRIVLELAEHTAASIEWSNGSVAGPLRVFARSEAVRASEVTQEADVSVSPPLGASEPDGSEAAFPPDGFAPQADSVIVDGGVASVFDKTDDSGARVLALDGRQLEFDIVAGTAVPLSDTGIVLSDEAREVPAGRAVVALAIPMPSSGAASAAYYGRGAWLGPIARDEAALWTGPDHSLHVGRWPFDGFEASGASVGLGLGEAAAPGVEGAWGLCVTHAGHLLYAWTAHGSVDQIRESWPQQCASEIALRGGANAGTLPITEPSHMPRLVAHGASREPPTVRDMAWTHGAAEGLPEPKWLPAVRKAEVSRLGASVKLQWFDPARFDWKLRAGTRERSHREGGDFPEELRPEDAERAVIAFGLGVGKRRRPRGLRIDGSIGHKFHGGDTVLVGRMGALDLLARGSVDRVEGDATELAETLDDGKLLPLARQRGPLQSRGDLCILDGAALIAEATFDSHEVTASVLAELGCDRAVALDRGSEDATWQRVGRAAEGPFETTALIGLSRPLVGRVRTQPPNGPPAPQPFSSAEPAAP